MASVSSLCSQFLRSPLSDSTPLSHSKRTRISPPFLLCSSSTNLSTTSSCICIEEQEQTKGSKRREALFQFVFAAVSLPSIGELALADSNGVEGFRVYSDEKNKYNISIPQDWQVGAAEADGIRSVTAFYPEETFNSNVSVLITGLGADFTKLESFGKVDEFAETLVSGLDRSWQRPPGVTAKLIDSKTKNGLYFIEYTLQNPGESRRHIISALGISNNGWYNRLYTITGQFLDEESEKYKTMIEKSVSSFRLT